MPGQAERASSGSSSSSEEAHRTTIVLRPPLTNPLTIIRRMMATYCEIIIASDQKGTAGRPQKTSASPSLFLKFKKKKQSSRLKLESERINSFLLLCEGRPRITAVHECLHREEHRVKHSVRSNFITHARKTTFPASLSNSCKPASDARGVSTCFINAREFCELPGKVRAYVAFCHTSRVPSGLTHTRSPRWGQASATSPSPKQPKTSANTWHRLKKL